LCQCHPAVRCRAGRHRARTAEQSHALAVRQEGGIPHRVHRWQAGFNRNPGKLQNFMIAAEARDIDDFHALDADIAPPMLDDRLADIVLRELEPDKPVLIYANKNGAFPLRHEVS
jgi:hypothetical protein